MADSDFSDDDVENVGGGADDVPKTKYVKLISYVHDHHFLKTPVVGRPRNPPLLFVRSAVTHNRKTLSESLQTRWRGIYCRGRML